MKVKIVSFVVAVSLLLAAFGAATAWASEKTTTYTGTVSIVDWVDQAPWKYTGGTIHDQAFVYFYFDTTDPRLTGTYVLDAKCNWPKGPFVDGPCQADWTLDVDGDGISDWAGVLTVSGPFWSGTGLGQGAFSGLHVSFQVQGPFDALVVDGQVIEN